MCTFTRLYGYLRWRQGFTRNCFTIAPIVAGDVNGIIECHDQPCQVATAFIDTDDKVDWQNVGKPGANNADIHDKLGVVAGSKKAKEDPTKAIKQEENRHPEHG